MLSTRDIVSTSASTDPIVRRGFSAQWKLLGRISEPLAGTTPHDSEQDAPTGGPMKTLDV